MHSSDLLHSIYVWPFHRCQYTNRPLEYSTNWCWCLCWCMAITSHRRAFCASNALTNAYLLRHQLHRTIKKKEKLSKIMQIKRENKKQTKINNTEISWSNLCVCMCFWVWISCSCDECVWEVGKKESQIKLTANKNEFVYICTCAGCVCMHINSFIYIVC